MELLDMVYPKICVGCGKWGEYVCEKCEIKMGEEEQVCPICGHNERYGRRHVYCKKDDFIEGLTCFWEYEGIVQKLIYEAKYSYYYDYLKFLTERSMKLLDRDEFFYFRKFLESKPLVVAVPLHKSREKERGFNQANIVAKLFCSTVYQLEVADLLVRVKDTGQQVGRDRKNRLENMREAFEIKSNNEDRKSKQYLINNIEIPKNVLLVDDVWTTGATMRECARILKRAGFERIWGLVLAR